LLEGGAEPGATVDGTLAAGTGEATSFCDVSVGALEAAASFAGVKIAVNAILAPGELFGSGATGPGAGLLCGAAFALESSAGGVGADTEGAGALTNGVAAITDIASCGMSLVSRNSLLGTGV
jgi:hypothetical protein